VHQVPSRLRIYMHRSDRYITASRNRDGCTSMRYHALAALLRYNALSVSCLLSFSVSSNQAHCLCLYAGQAGDSAPEWLLPWFILTYLLVTCSSAILHTCHSSTSCSSRRATTHCLHIICGTVRVKRNTPLFVSAGRLGGSAGGPASIAAGYGFGGAKGTDPSAAGKRRCYTLLG
jgi:hypothetical protein